MNYLAEKYQQRRKTIPWTQAECDAFQREHDIDPTGEYGLRILDRHLQAIDRVKLLCKQNPNKPKVREAILAEYRSFAEDIAAIGKEAADKFKEMKMASSNFKPLRSENPEVSPDFFEEFIRSIRYGNILVRSIKVDETPKMVAEVDVATAWAKSRLHVHGRLEVAGKFETQEGRIDLKEPPPHVKCIVKDCENHMDQGTFVGEICYSCYEHMTTGKVGPTTSILRKIKDAELFILKGHDGKIVTQGQFNALVAENATLKERLETVRLDLVRWAAELGCTMPNAHFKDLLTVIYAKAKERPKSEFAGLLHTAWGIIANANEGDWTKAVPEWKEAAARWRDEYHAFLKSLRR